MELMEPETELKLCESSIIISPQDLVDVSTKSQERLDEKIREMEEDYQSC